MNAHKQAAEECIPLKPKTKHKVPWENEIVEEKRECLIKMARSKNKTLSRINISKYRTARQKIEEEYNSEQQKYIEQPIDIIKDAGENKQSALA